MRRSTFAAAQPIFLLPEEDRGPFGSESPPWYKRRAARRGGAPPKAARIVVGVTSTLAAGALAGGIRGWAKPVVGALVIAVPAFVLDGCWRARERRREERLLPDLESRSG